ncbi:MAG: trypsin-like peptidase domain-containing protein [Elainellaceae cyanobacterium]
MLPDRDQQDRYNAAIARIYKGDLAVGTGFLAADSYVLTCAHVVTVALDIPRNSDSVPDSLTVKLDFPFIAPGVYFDAQVVFWEPVNSTLTQGDIAGLRLDGALPAGVRPAQFAPDEHYSGHHFHVLGFPSGHKEDGLPADGIIDAGLVTRRIVVRSESNQGFNIEPGFSGAPIWDKELKGVVGMVVAVEQEREAAEAAYMIPYELLAPALDTSDLLRFLSSAWEQAEGSIRQAYQICRRDRRQFPINPETPQDLLDSLRRMPTDMEYSTLRQFAACLALDELQAPQLLQELLRRWLSQKLNSDYQAVLESMRLLAQSYVEELTTARTSTTAPHLMVHINVIPQDIQTESYSVKAVFIPDPDRYDYATGQGSTSLENPDKFDNGATRKTLPELLRNYLQQSGLLLKSRGDIALLNQLKIDVFLPLAWLSELFDESPRFCPQSLDQWPLYGEEEEEDEEDIERIGTEYCAVIRCSERLDPKYVHAEPRWVQRWNCSSNQATAAKWTPSTQKKDLKLEQFFGHWSSTVPTKSVLLKMIKTGTPAAVWLRNGDCEVEAKDILLKTMCACLTHDLPQQVKELRQSAPVQDPLHANRCISLLLENPKLRPASPSTQDVSSSPKATGSTPDKFGDRAPQNPSTVYDLRGARFGGGFAGDGGQQSGGTNS